MVLVRLLWTMGVGAPPSLFLPPNTSLIPAHFLSYPAELGAAPARIIVHCFGFVCAYTCAHTHC